jgi:DNA-binding NarL/FixJ family response regulator
VIVVGADFETPRGSLHIATRVAAQRCHAAVVILLDNSSRDDFVLQAFRGGVRGVFSRSQSLEEMGKCIECVAAGQVWASGEQMDSLLAALKSAVLPRFSQNSAASLLSRREQEVVRHLCDGLTNREIAHALDLSEHTVKNHLFRIYAKLGVEKRTEVVFSLMSPASPMESLQPEISGAAAAGSDPLYWYLQWAEYSVRAQFLLRKSLQNAVEQHDPVAAYTWLLRSERGAVELIRKCRAIKAILAPHVTSEQHQQAECLAAQGSTDPRGIPAETEPAPALQAPLTLTRPSMFVRKL